MAVTAATVPASPQSAARAALWMTGAVVSFSAMAVAGREMSVQLDTFEIMLYRSFIGLVVVLSAALWSGRLATIRARRMGVHLTRNLFHFTGQNLWFYAVAVIPLAQVFALEFTTPIWVAMIAPFVLGERMTRWRALAAVAGFIGVLLVARPGMIQLVPAHAAALLAALAFTGSVLSTKHLARTESTFSILFWMTTMQLVMGVVCALPGGIAVPTLSALPWVVLIGICGLSAHFCITSALHCAPASVVSPMDFARLPVIAVVGMLLYGEPLELAVFVGGALILAGNLLNLRAERRRLTSRAEP